MVYVQEHTISGNVRNTKNIKMKQEAGKVYRSRRFVVRGWRNKEIFKRKVFRRNYELRWIKWNQIECLCFHRMSKNKKRRLQPIISMQQFDEKIKRGKILLGKSFRQLKAHVMRNTNSKETRKTLEGSDLIGFEFKILFRGIKNITFSNKIVF